METGYDKYLEFSYKYPLSFSLNDVVGFFFSDIEKMDLKNVFQFMYYLCNRLLDLTVGNPKLYHESVYLILESLIQMVYREKLIYCTLPVNDSMEQSFRELKILYDLLYDEHINVITPDGNVSNNVTKLLDSKLSKYLENVHTSPIFFVDKGGMIYVNFEYFDVLDKFSETVTYDMQHNIEKFLFTVVESWIFSRLKLLPFSWEVDRDEYVISNNRPLYTV